MSPFNQVVRGCAECPLLSFRTRDEDSPACNVNAEVSVPLDADGEAVLALPADCPLWAGPATVSISLPGGARVGGDAS